MEQLCVTAKCQICGRITVIPFDVYTKILTGKIETLACQYCKSKFPTYLWEHVKEPWNAS